MLDNIVSIFRDQCNLSPDRPVLVGVSGGPDSLCLMESLHQAGYTLVVAHFNHLLRPDSEQEAEALKKILLQKNIDHVIEKGDVGGFAGKEGYSIEEAARILRYRFLFIQAQKHNAQAVAVGHTADDQVETVIMHFLRGAGLTGLKGMQYRSYLPAFDESIPVVRPLLGVWKQETVQFCQINGLQPFHDPSNDSNEFLRNRIRNTLIPQLETYNPRIREGIWRMASTLSDDYALLNTALNASWKECLKAQEAGLITFDAKVLSGYPPGLQRNMIRQALQQLAPDIADLRFSTLENAAAMLSSRRYARVDLPEGIQLILEGDLVYMVADGVELPFENWPQMPPNEVSLSMSIPGKIDLSGGWSFSADWWDNPTTALELAISTGNQFQAWLDADSLPSQIEVRSRNPGDQFEPLGMDGQSMKLSDFFINNKVPQRARDAWPLLCSGEAVIWVPGYCLAHSYRLKQDTSKVIKFCVNENK